MLDSSGGGSGNLKVLAPLEGVSSVGDASGGILIRLFLRCDLHVSLLDNLPQFLPANLPQFLPVSELASIASSDSVIHLITFW